MKTKRKKSILPGFGDRLRVQRHEAGLSQIQLAYLAGVSQAGIANLENEHSSPALPLLVGLAVALEIKIDSLIPAKYFQKK